MKYFLLIFLVFFFSFIPAFSQNCGDCLSIYGTCFPTKVSSSIINEYLTNTATNELKGDYQSAYKEMSEAIKVEPNLAILYLRRAKVSFRLKNMENVFQDVQTAIAFKLDNEYSWRDFLTELDKRSYKEENLKIFEMLISSDALRHLGYHLRSVFKASLGDYVGFVEDRIKSLEFFPLNEIPNLSPLAVILEARLKNHPNFLDYALQIRDLLEKRAEYYSRNSVKILVIRNCKEEFIEVSEIFGKDLLNQAHDFILYIQRSYQQQGQTEKEIETIKRISRFETKENAYYFRAVLFASRKYYKEAIEDATILIDLNKQNPVRHAGFLLYRGDLYVLAKQYNEAIKDYEAAISINRKTESNALKKIESAKQKMQEEANQQ